MSYEEIVRCLQYNEKESNLFMPNEIFEDLKLHVRNTPHIAFAYSYCYLATWLYRYVKHSSVTEILDNKKLKELLGYNPKTQTLDYLIKKNGLLDEIEYLESTRDFPLTWSLTGEEKDLDFFMLSDLDIGVAKEKFPNIPKRFFLKKPLKGFSRIKLNEDGQEYESLGTFYDIANTHNVPFEGFLYCMSNRDIGCTGFYLYSYLKHKNDLFENGYDVSLANLSLDTGIKESTLDKYIGLLKGYRMVDFRHNQEFFAIGMRAEDRKANTYLINEHDSFSNELETFQKIKIVKKKVEKRIEFDVNQLPF